MSDIPILVLKRDPECCVECPCYHDSPNAKEPLCMIELRSLYDGYIYGKRPEWCPIRYAEVKDDEK